MKTKKTMSSAAVQANRANATKSTGPTTQPGQATTRYNALKHSLRAHALLLESEHDKKEFKALVRSLNESLNPVGDLERLHIDEIALLWWKLQIAGALEARELMRLEAHGTDCSNFLSAALHSGAVKVPIRDSSFSPPFNGAGWEIEQLAIKAVGGNGELGSHLHRDEVKHPQTGVPTQRAFGGSSSGSAQVELHAVLGRALDRYSRYNTSLRREFHRSLDALHRLQAARIERDES